MISINGDEIRSNHPVNLISYEKQYFKILPTFKIVLTDALFSTDLPNFIQSNILIPEITYSYPMLNNKNVIIEFEKAFIKDVKSDLLRNLNLLEGVTDKVKVNILNKKKQTEFKSTLFNYKDSVVGANIIYTNNSFRKISFQIRHNKFKEILSLIDHSFISRIENFNFTNLEFQGVYNIEKNTLLFERVIVSLNESSSIIIKGKLNFDKLDKNDLFIKGTNMTRSDMIKIFDLIKMNKKELPIQLGELSHISISYKNNNLSLVVYDLLSKIQKFEFFRTL